MKTTILAAATAIGLLASAAIAQAQSVTIDTGLPGISRGDGVRVIDRDRRREGRSDRYVERRDDEGGRTVRKTVTRNADGSVTRTKTIRTQDDD